MIQKVTVRGFSAGDEKGMVRIHHDSMEKFEKIDIDENFILRLSNRTDFRFFIAEIDRGLVGFLGVAFYTNVDRAEIGPIAIDKKHKNSGVGSKLLEDCENFLRAIGTRRVIAKVKYDNNEGINFFKKNGFEHEAVLRRYTKGCEDVVQLVKFL